MRVWRSGQYIYLCHLARTPAHPLTQVRRTHQSKRQPTLRYADSSSLTTIRCPATPMTSHHHPAIRSSAVLDMRPLPNLSQGDLEKIKEAHAVASSKESNPTGVEYYWYRYWEQVVSSLGLVPLCQGPLRNVVRTNDDKKKRSYKLIDVSGLAIHSKALHLPLPDPHEDNAWVERAYLGQYKVTSISRDIIVEIKRAPRPDSVALQRLSPRDRRAHLWRGYEEYIRDAQEQADSRTEIHFADSKNKDSKYVILIAASGSPYSWKAVKRDPKKSYEQLEDPDYNPSTSGNESDNPSIDGERSPEANGAVSLGNQEVGAERARENGRLGLEPKTRVGRRVRLVEAQRMQHER
ncbi:hypothetical protein C8Q77DRAFT_755318 [Trametes polyzona]|nr:hypothetical protein C8Q77DRAFT_755318 [Trametes polyzona]